MTTTIEPVETTNLDRYGFASLPWSRPRDLLDKMAPDESDADRAPGLTTWVATTSPGGRPHLTAVGAIWVDGRFYFTSGAGTRKSRNLAADPHCVLSVSLAGIDVVVEGTAEIVRDQATLDRLADLYNKLGWEPRVEDGAFTAPYSAPSAGPPPWDLFAVRPATIFGVANVEPYGATRWRFAA